MNTVVDYMLYVGLRLYKPCAILFVPSFFTAMLGFCINNNTAAGIGLVLMGICVLGIAVNQAVWYIL